MNLGPLLLDGVKATALGMLWVFCFLLIMIGLMTVMAKLLAPYSHFLEPVVPQPKKKATKEKKAAVAALSDADKVLAMAAIEAVKLHRSGK